MWTIEYSDEAVKALNRPRSDLARRIRDKIRQVAADPCAPDNTLKPLDGKPAFAVTPGSFD